MNTRVALARLLIRLGQAIQSLAIMVMRPDDLVEFGRQMYARPHNVSQWSEQELVNEGLRDYEMALLAQLPARKGRLLLLGVGGGREAIPLAQMGFEVVGVDFVPSMIAQAQENAIQRGVHIGGLVQEISQLDVPPGSYDVIWFSLALFSCLPTRTRRIAMLQRVRRALSPDGRFVCQFAWGASETHSAKAEMARRVVAYLTMGNISYEPGDTLWGNAEFLHFFSSEAEIRAEFEEGGFDVLYLQICERMFGNGAVLAAKERPLPGSPKA